MSDTVKLIIEIPKEAYNTLLTEQVLPPHIDVEWLLIHGIPLDDVKADIAEGICLTDNPYTKETKYTIEHSRLLEILDNIGKAESEDME